MYTVLLKINYVSYYYLPITDLVKLSDFGVLIEVTVLAHVFVCLLIGLAIFVDGILQCFQVEKNVFCGDGALFAGSFDSLLNLDDASIMLTSTRFNNALIFFLICCRISSSVRWSNKT